MTKWHQQYGRIPCREVGRPSEQSRLFPLHCSSGLCVTGKKCSDNLSRYMYDMLWFYMIYIQTALLSKRPTGLLLKRPIGTRNGDTLPFKSIFFNISGGVEPPWAVEIPDQLLLLSLRRPNSFFFCSHSLHTQKNKDLWGYAPTMNPV